MLSNICPNSFAIIVEHGFPSGAPGWWSRVHRPNLWLEIRRKSRNDLVAVRYHLALTLLAESKHISEFHPQNRFQNRSQTFSQKVAKISQMNGMEIAHCLENDIENLPKMSWQYWKPHWICFEIEWSSWYYIETNIYIVSNLSNIYQRIVKT